MSSTDTARYLRKLFNPGESICMTNDVTGTEVLELGHHEALIEHVSTPRFVALNPMHTRRLDANVTAHRNLLIEFDGMGLEEQAAKLVDLDVPYTTLTFSGGKSLHAVIALSEAVTPEAYAEIFDYLRIILWQADRTARNPSRLTRVAGATRDNGVVQELLDLRKRVPVDRVQKWIARFHAHIERHRQREAAEAARRAEELAQRQAAGAAGLALVDSMTMKFLKGEIGTKGSRHARLVAAVFELHESGVEYDEALALAEHAADIHGITADPKRAREAQSVVNYVYGSRA